MRTSILAALTVMVCSSGATIATAQRRRPSPSREAPAPVVPATQAERDARARELYSQGDRAYAEGRYNDAIRAFRDAYDLSGRFLLLFNLANACERAGLYRDAATHLRRYAEAAPAGERGQLDSRIRNLETRAAEIETAEANRQADAMRQLRLAREAEERERQRLRLEHERELEQLRAQARDREHQPGTPEAPASNPPILGWTLVGAGTLGVGAGIVLSVLTSDARTQARASCGASGLCLDGAAPSVQRDATLSLVTDIAFIASAALIATGVVLVITHSSGESTSTSSPARSSEPVVLLGVAPIRHGAGAVVSGTF